MSTSADGETRRGLRDSTWGRVALLVLVLAAAGLLAKTCASTDTAVSQDEAIVIAKEQVDFEPNQVMVRYIQQGLKPRPYWAVSLSDKQPDGALDNLTVVVVDANTGEVTEIRRSG